MPSTIRLGSVSMDVQTLRGALASAGFHPTYAVNDPNLFDAWVDAAVRAYQKMKGLTVDGIVGPQTWTALLGTAGVPSTATGAGAVASQPNTQSDPGRVTPPVPTITPAGKPADNTMMGFVLLLGAGIAVWMWRGSKKRGGAYAGRPFAEGGAEDEPRESKRAARARQAEIMRAYEIELKRNEVDPERQPGWAARIKRQVERAIETEKRLLDRAQAEELRRHDEKHDPRVRAEILREQDADIRERTPEERAEVVASIRRMRPELGKGIKHKATTYREERTPVGRKLFPGRTGPSAPMRNVTEAEVERWAQKVESGKRAAQATKRIHVQSKRYQTDRVYREREQDDARRIAEETRSEVHLVNERGVPLFKYQPNVRNFKDVTSERLIAQVEDDARKGNCPKAVRGLFKVRPLALDQKTEDLLDGAARAVASNCEDELRGDLGEREEAREEVEKLSRRTVKRGELEAAKLDLIRKRSKRGEQQISPNAIRMAVKRGELSPEDAKDLLIIARDLQRSEKAAREAMYEPGKTSTKMLRKRRGELPAIIVTDTSGRKRTTRIKG